MAMTITSHSDDNVRKLSKKTIFDAYAIKLSKKTIFKKIDLPLLFFALFLSFFGLVVLYSLSSFSGEWHYFQRQFIFLLAGIVSSFLITSLNVRAFKKSPYLIFSLYLVSLLILFGLLFFAPSIRGSRSWYIIFGVSFQPVEITKIIFILLFAKFFSERYVDMYQAKHVIVSAIYAFLPAFLVFIQPDFGSAAVLVFLWLSMLLISGIKRNHIIAILVISIIVFIISWNFFLSFEQKTRVSTFLEPYFNPRGEYLDPKGTGYHILQSLIAIGSGGFSGKGFFASYTQAKLGFLPEASTDFIFAAFAEMFGIAGILLLFLLFTLFFWRIIKIAKIARDNFSRLLVSGFAVLLFLEIFINIAMNIGLLPISGLPLPFLSYGGSSLISLFIGIGIIESIKAHSA